MRVVAGTALLFALLVPLPSAPAAEPTAQELLAAVERQMRAVSDTAGPCVACVVVSRSELYPKLPGPAAPGRLGDFDPGAFANGDPTKVDLARRLDLSDRRTLPDHGCAGGVVIDAAGLVLTTYHVIDGATKVYVHLPGGKGSYADIHAADARSDLAVLRLITPPDGLHPVKIGEVRVFDLPNGARANVFPGKLTAVLAHGYVSGFAADRPSLFLGQLTNVRKRFDTPTSSTTNTSIYVYGALLEYASLSRPQVGLPIGCSGAAVVNLDGELIGLTTTAAVVSGPETGPGFALPIDAGLRGIIDVLRRGEEVEYGFLGVSANALARGPIVLSTVSPNSPAERAGLRVGDRIVRINGQPAREFHDLLLYATSALAGGKVRLMVETGAARRELTVTLAKIRNEAPSIASVRPEPVFGLRVDWSSLLAQTLRTDTLGGVRPGVIVREIVPGSAAATRFKALGDESRWLITRVNGTAVATPAEFYAAARGQPKVTLTLIDPYEPTPTERTVTLP